MTPFLTCIYELSTAFKEYQDVALVISLYYILKSLNLFFCNKSILQFFHAWCFKGLCAEYNIIGGRIQPHIGVNCSIGNPPCPNSSYISTEAYRCKYNNLYISSLLHIKSSFYLYFISKLKKKKLNSIRVYSREYQTFQHYTVGFIFRQELLWWSREKKSLYINSRINYYYE